MKPGMPSTDTSTWYTTNDVLDTFSVSHATLESYVKKGLLHPVKGRRTSANNSTREVWLFNPDEFRNVPWSRRDKLVIDPNEIAARAFDLMEEGEDLRALVRRLRLTPERVIELRAQWEDLGGAGVILGRAARGELAEIVGEFDDIAGLVQRVRSVVSVVSEVAPVRCPRCAGADGVEEVVDGRSSPETESLLGEPRICEPPALEAAHFP